MVKRKTDSAKRLSKSFIVKENKVFDFADKMYYNAKIKAFNVLLCKATEKHPNRTQGLRIRHNYTNLIHFKKNYHFYTSFNNHLFTPLPYQQLFYYYTHSSSSILSQVAIALHHMSF